MAHLDEQDLRQFAANGYLLLRHVVDEPILLAADSEIAKVVRELPPTDGDRGPGPNQWFVQQDLLSRSERLLTESPAVAAAEELVAPNKLHHAFEHIQIATTVPPWSHVPGGPHIDGHAPHQDPPASFTMLVAVFLSDQPSKSGNLWVWPGSHLVHSRLFVERGTKVLHQTGGHSTLLDPPLSLGDPLEITAHRGDLLLAHYLLGHNKGGNTGTSLRRTIYFRLATADHRTHWESTFLDPWTEYAPIGRLAQSVHPHD